MRPALPSLIILALALLACTPPGPKGIDPDVLDEAVGAAIGDPGTCVLLVSRPQGKIVWQYGSQFNCSRPLPDCKGGAGQSARDLIGEASAGTRITSGCASLADASRQVGWATGPAGSPDRQLAYVALMEITSERALPGREIATRLERALTRAGLGTAE